MIGGNIHRPCPMHDPEPLYLSATRSRSHPDKRTAPLEGFPSEEARVLSDRKTESLTTVTGADAMPLIHTLTHSDLSRRPLQLCKPSLAEAADHDRTHGGRSRVFPRAPGKRARWARADTWLTRASAPFGKTRPPSSKTVGIHLPAAGHQAYQPETPACCA